MFWEQAGSIPTPAIAAEWITGGHAGNDLHSVYGMRNQLFWVMETWFSFCNQKEAKCGDMWMRT